MQNNAVGISVKSQFYHDLYHGNHNIDFLEAHIENYLGGGYHLDYLYKLSKKYNITLHGVGLSLGGSALPLLRDIQARKKIIDFIQPAIFSEHAAWTRHDHHHFHDLLPLPLNQTTVKIIADNICYLQDHLKQNILLENLSAYITFDDDDMMEYDFMNEISRISGCYMLLDINNIFVQEHNLKRSAGKYIDHIDKKYVRQYHLAGGEFFDNTDMIADTHGTDISEDVFDLYEYALKKIGLHPTLYERDNNIPSLADMQKQVDHIRYIHKKLGISSSCP